MWNSPMASTTGTSPRGGTISCRVTASNTSRPTTAIQVRTDAVHSGVTCVTMILVTVQLTPQASTTVANSRSAVGVDSSGCSGWGRDDGSTLIGWEEEEEAVREG